MHVLENKNTGEIQVFKYSTPELNSILGYSEQYFRRLIAKDKVIETKNYKVTPNCYYNSGNRGGFRSKKQ